MADALLESAVISYIPFLQTREQTKQPVCDQVRLAVSHSAGLREQRAVSEIQTCKLLTQYTCDQRHLLSALRNLFFREGTEGSNAKRCELEGSIQSP